MIDKIARKPAKASTAKAFFPAFEALSCLLPEVGQPN